MGKWNLKRIKKVGGEFFRNPLIIVPKLGGTFWVNWIPDKLYLKICYRVRIGKRLDLLCPKTFNEKLQWLKLNDRNPMYTNLVDKYMVRKYVEDKIGGKYLVPLVGIWDRPEDIDFTKLPSNFVLKCTHDSGGVFVWDSKKALCDEKIAKAFLKKRFKRNYYYVGREWPYKNVNPRIIAEANIKSSEDCDLKDYKFMCYRGKVNYIFTCSNREKGLYVDFFDKEWNHLPFRRHYPNNPEPLGKPENLNQMLVISEKLSDGLNFVRVDLYEVEGKIYFGELTFYPGSGVEEFTPEYWDEILGKDLELVNYH